MTSHSNFKESFFERPMDIAEGYLFEFDVIGEVLLQGIIILLEKGNCKIRNVALDWQRWKSDLTKQL